jgi:uncharacterized protein YybS (DUF2232 family)
MIQLFAGDFAIATLVDFFIDAILAHFITDSLTVFMPNPNILFIHEKFALMTWNDIAKKRATKGRPRVNQVALSRLTASLNVWAFAQNA